MKFLIEGQCGTGDTSDHLVPVQVLSIKVFFFNWDFLLITLKDIPITSISCGQFTSMAFYPGTQNMYPPPLFGKKFH
jgi:hypothetical protein